MLSKAARTFPDQAAIIHGNRHFTYAQFNKRANRLAGALNSHGLQRGNNVAILQYNYPETLESIFACFKAGIGAVPINFRLHPKECAFIIDHSQAKAVIISPEFNKSLIEVRKLIPNVELIITTKDAGGDFVNYESLLNDSDPNFSDIAVDPDELAWLFYTSGTTGRPKGAMLTHRNLLAMTMNFFADMTSLEPGDAVLHAAPISHGSGLYGLPNVAKAATNVILNSKSFDPELVCQTIEKHCITNMFAAPTMIKLLVESDAIDHYDLSSLKCLNYGGAPMYANDMKLALKKLGPCLVQLYGQGEAPMTITYLPKVDHITNGTPEQEKRLTSTGIERTDVEVKIFDAQDRELPSGEIGEVVTRSDLVMKGYWRNPEATATTIRNGWLHTGDIGYIDEKGYLFLMDRSKDMVITGGENVYPREIEEVLQNHPAVHEVSVFGIPDPKWGEAIKAVVVLNPGQEANSTELIDFCKDNLAGYKKPKSVDFVDELPKNNYGKILKRALRDPYWEGKDRKVI